MSNSSSRTRTLAVPFALVLGTFALATSAAMAQQALTEPQVQAKLTAQGYTKVNDMTFKDGMWRADAKSANGNHVQVRIDAKTGKVYPDEQVSQLSERDVRASLETQGYTHVHDVDFDDGVWKAKADNPAGNDVTLRVDAGSGKVIGAD